MEYATVEIESRPMADKKEKSQTSDERNIDKPLDELKKTLDKLPPDVLKEAREKMKPFLEGDMGWLDLLNLSPEEQQKMAEMGYHQFQAGYLDEAEVIFKGLTVIEPENYYYHSMLGAIYQRKKMLPESIVEYSMAIHENAADIVSLTNRGEVFIDVGLYKQAQDDLELAIALDPEGQDPWGRRAENLKKKVESLQKVAAQGPKEKK